jgi:hypothetical protein
MKATRARLREAYPFGERKYHPYKIWLDEIRRQLGTTDKKGIKTDLKKLQEWEALYGKRQV